MPAKPNAPGTRNQGRRWAEYLQMQQHHQTSQQYRHRHHKQQETQRLRPPPGGLAIGRAAPGGARCAKGVACSAASGVLRNTPVPTRHTQGDGLWSSAHMFAKTCAAPIVFRRDVICCCHSQLVVSLHWRSTGLHIAINVQVYMHLERPCFV